jgi:hypothetical protein
VYHQHALVLHERDRREYKREMTWKAPLAAGAFLGSLLLGVVSPAQATAAGTRAAGILNGTGKRHVDDFPGRKPKLELGDLTDPPEEAAVMEAAKDEARSRRYALETPAK